jgi:fibronectin type 3 domain-containing protein
LRRCNDEKNEKGKVHWTKTRVKQTISYEKERYMVIFAKIMVEAVEADEARGKGA